MRMVQQIYRAGTADRSSTKAIRPQHNNQTHQTHQRYHHAYHHWIRLIVSVSIIDARNATKRGSSWCMHARRVFRREFYVRLSESFLAR